MLVCDFRKRNGIYHLLRKTRGDCFSSLIAVSEVWMDHCFDLSSCLKIFSEMKKKVFSPSFPFYFLLKHLSCLHVSIESLNNFRLQRCGHSFIFVVSENSIEFPLGFCRQQKLIDSPTLFPDTIVSF